MQNRTLTAELDQVLSSLLEGEEAGKYPKDILKEVSRIGDAIDYTCLDIDRFLERSLEADSDSQLFDIVLRQLGITRRIYGKLRNLMRQTAENRPLSEFLTVRSEALGVFMKDVIAAIALRFTDINQQNESWRSEAVSLKKRVDALENELARERSSRDTRESYFSRDLQAILQHAHTRGDGVAAEKIDRVVNESLADLGLEVLWEVPDGDHGRCFAVESKSDPSDLKVLCPCILKKDRVIHQGVVGTPKI